MATFLQLYTRAKNMAVTSDSTEAKAFVNDVYRDLVVDSQSLCTNVSPTLTTGVNTYTFSTSFSIADLGMVQYLLYKAVGESQGYVLEPASLEEVLQLSATNPTGYVRKYALQGLDRVYLWPSPATTGDVLQIFYAQTPVVLTADGDLPSSIPSQWHHLISLGAAARLSDAIGEDVQLGMALQAKYDVAYLKYVAWVKNRQGRGTQRMPSGYVRSVGFPLHDRSAYYSNYGS